MTGRSGRELARGQGRRVGLVIPAYNRLSDTIACLEACLALSYPDFQVYLVDDGSSDATPEVIPNRYPAVRYVRADGSLWWTGCINRGVSVALDDGCEFVVLMNQDVLLDREYLTDVVGAYDRHGPGLYGGIVLYQQEPERIWAAGGLLHWVKGTIYKRQRDMLAQVNPTGEVEEVDWLPGMGTLIPATLIGELGYHDDVNLPHYFSDAEYCIRAKRRSYPVRLVWKARLWHSVGEYDPYVRGRREGILSLLRRFRGRKSFLDVRTNWVFYRLVFGKCALLWFGPHTAFMLAVATRDYWRSLSAAGR